MDEKTKLVDGHYQVPLLFRNADVAFLNKLQHIMTRQRQSSMAWSVKVMQVAAGRSWYILCHGLYHSAKPGKIRVVFDCSEEYVWASIHCELMSAPNLTNQIWGTLLRFREARVACCHWGKFLPSLSTSRTHTSFRRFFQWKGSNGSSDIVDYEMNAHIFVGTFGYPPAASCSWR